MIEIEDYVLNPIRLNKKKKLDWYKLWIDKCDYITSYYNNIKGKYLIIDNSIDYYIVMIEMCLFFLKDYSNYYDFVYIQHNIIINGKLSIKEDIKERDFAEYIKYLFYNNYDIEYICDLINKSSNNFNYYLVGVRLLFPSYYLFYFENVVLNDKDYDKLCDIVRRNTNYEKFLKTIINELNKYLQKKIVLPF